MTFKMALMTAVMGLTAFVQTSAVAMADIVIIGHPSNNNKLKPDEVSKIYLGKMRTFPDGRSIKPIDQAEGREPRQEFLDTVLHKNESALKSYWSALVFTGNGVPPDVIEDDAAVKKFVAANPGAVGYIDSKSVDASVKVLLAVDKSNEL